MNFLDLEQITPDTLQSCEARLSALCEEFGFEHGSYVSLARGRDRAIGFATYPETWREAYVSMGLWKEDPILQHCPHTVRPVDWQAFCQKPEHQSFFQKARQHGIGSNGITLPANGPDGKTGILSLSKPCSDRDWDALVQGRLPELQHQANLVHFFATGLTSIGPRVKFEKLSDLERRVLQLNASGASVPAIAWQVTKPERVVHQCFNAINLKLRSATIEQSVGRAIALKLINVDRRLAQPVAELFDSGSGRFLGLLVEWDNGRFEISKAVANSPSQPGDLVSCGVPISLRRFADVYNLRVESAAAVLELDPSAELCLNMLSDLGAV